MQINIIRKRNFTKTATFVSLTLNIVRRGDQIFCEPFETSLETRYKEVYTGYFSFKRCNTYVDRIIPNNYCSRIIIIDM